MKKAVAFTIVDDDHYYPEGTHIFVNSFKYFHPDIDLVVFRQNTIDSVFKDKNINFFQAKPTFAKLLCKDYELVVNIDADHVICSYLDEVFDQNYDVGGPWNFNDYENAGFENITEEMYVQAGMVASRKPEFWDIWEEANKDAMKYLRKENDTLNLVWYNDPVVSKMNRVIWDKEKNYLGCKSLGREPQFYIDENKLMCRKEQVKAYHFARGNHFPKLDFYNMPFTVDVQDWLQHLGFYGQTVKIGGLGE
jgi:hypothetical protein